MEICDVKKLLEVLTAVLAFSAAALWFLAAWAGWHSYRPPSTPEQLRARAWRLSCSSRSPRTCLCVVRSCKAAARATCTQQASARPAGRQLGRFCV